MLALRRAQGWRCVHEKLRNVNPVVLVVASNDSYYIFLFSTSVICFPWSGFLLHLLSRHLSVGDPGSKVFLKILHKCRGTWINLEPGEQTDGICVS